jgi:Protein of unknown function (DUF2281)
MSSQVIQTPTQGISHMMSSELLNTLKNLPEPLQQEVLHYAEFLADKYSRGQPENILTTKHRQAGTMKGMIVMSDDFDEPLEDLKVYM